MGYLSHELGVSHINDRPASRPCYLAGPFIFFVDRQNENFHHFNSSIILPSLHTSRPPIKRYQTYCSGETITSLQPLKMAESEDRKKRKEEGRLQKRQRIDESGGVRPRKNEEGGGSNESSAPKKRFEGDSAAYSPKNTTTSMDRRPRPKQSTSSGHRFGRVMEIVPCRNKPRYSTLSIALPGSVLSNCQTRELRTLLVGQIARAATIYHVDEIIVFDDKLAKNQSRDNGGWRRPRDRDDKRARESRHEKEKIEEKKIEEEKTEEEKTEGNSNAEGGEPQERPRFQRSDPQTFMARLLQYCECPQYLRRHFFPMHPDLQFAGLLAPVDAPHHVREGDRSKYREGVVLEKKSPRPDGGSLVNCGIRNRPVE